MRAVAVLVAGLVVLSTAASELGQPLDCSDWVFLEPGYSCERLGNGNDQSTRVELGSYAQFDNSGRFFRLSPARSIVIGVCGDTDLYRTRLECRMKRQATDLIAVLAAGIAFSASSSQTQSTATGSQLIARANEFVQTCCRLAGGALPDIRIADRGLGKFEGGLAGRYVRPGETVGGVRYDQPTILLRPEVESLSSVELNALLYHEMLHYTIDTSGPPGELQSQLANVRQALLERFDLSQVPPDYREAVLSSLLDSVESYLEHIYIGDRVVERFESEPGALSALRHEMEYLVTHKRDLESFWKTGGKLMIEGQMFHYSPKDSAASRQTATDRSFLPETISGMYECESGPFCDKMRSRSEVQSDPYGGVTITTTVSFLQVDVTGSTVRIASQMTVTTPPRTYNYMDSVTVNVSGTRSTTESACTLTWDGDRGVGWCETRVHSDPSSTSMMGTTTTIPGFDNALRTESYLRVVSPGRLEFGAPGAVSHVYRRIGAR